MQRRKLKYVPGLISLIGLPLLLFVFGPNDKPKQNVLTINLPSDDTINTQIFSRASTERMLKGKRIEQIILNEIDDYDGGETYLSGRRQNFIQNELERLQFTHDTDTVLKIKLMDRNTYEQYISLLNLAVIDRYRRYVFIDDAFYFFADKSPIERSSNLVTSDLYDVSSCEQSGTWTIFYWRMVAKWQLFSYEIQTNKLLSIGFVVLIFIPFLLNLVIKRKRVLQFSV